MALLTTVGNGAIQGSATTLANADVDKSASGDTLIVFDKSATQFKRVSASGLGGGKFLGCLLYTSPSPRDATLSRMPSSA